MLSPLLFAEEAIDLSWEERDAVAPAPVSEKAKRKKEKKRTDEDLPVHSFRTLLKHLGLYQEVAFRPEGEREKVSLFVRETLLDPLYSRAFELIGCGQYTKKRNAPILLTGKKLLRIPDQIFGLKG